MTCLAEERFVEILDRGGLDAGRPDERAHLESCDACRDSWATVAAAAELLAEARPKAARGRLLPVMIAAAMLLTIVGVIVWKSATTLEQAPDPIVLLLEGDVQKAREALLKQGRKAIPVLLAARPRFKGSPRLQALQDVIFDLKLAALKQDPEAVAVFGKLEATRIDLHFENTMVAEIVSFIRQFTRLNITLDPTLDGGTVDRVDLKKASLRYSLEVICALKDLDFDYRYGGIFITTRMRLWSQDPAVGLPTANAWEAQILAGADAAVAAKLRLLKISMEMENMPLSALAEYVTEISGIPVKPSAEISAATVVFRASDTSLVHALQLLTLPNGWDVRIADGAVQIVPRRR